MQEGEIAVMTRGVVAAVIVESGDDGDDADADADADDDADDADDDGRQ